MSNYRNLSAIVFDMDGVTIDSEPAHQLAKKRAFARLGVTCQSLSTISTKAGPTKP
jgi:beta-phosphoglucomutase-like phosphatase (HAD superfamily)